MTSQTTATLASAEESALIAEKVAMAGYFNAGQDCTVTTRVIAGPRVHADFIDALTEQAKKVESTYAHGPSDEDALLPR
jgi:betaine-aldehyde dehydrogenase